MHAPAALQKPFSLAFEDFEDMIYLMKYLKYLYHYTYSSVFLEVARRGAIPKSVIHI